MGLTEDDEDVDAIELLGNGQLLLSTFGPFGVTGASGAGEDIIRFTPNSLGATTAGTYAMYFDGSDVSLNSTETVDALAIDPTGKLYLSTNGDFSVPRPGGILSGANEDVFVFTPTTLGATTAGTYSSTLYFDGSLSGLGANNITAIDLPSAAPLLAGSGSSGSSESLHASPGSIGVVRPVSLTVSVADGVGSLTADQRARVQDSIDTLNDTLGSSGVSLTLVDGASAAIRLHQSATSLCGGVATGVLGCATNTGDITLIEGWNWYTGSDPSSIGPEQYDYQAIVTHELAHALGLNHSDDSGSVLYDRLSPGVAHRDLTAHDLAVLRPRGSHRLMSALELLLEPAMGKLDE